MFWIITCASGTRKRVAESSELVPSLHRKSLRSAAHLLHLVPYVCVIGQKTGTDSSVALPLLFLGSRVLDVTWSLSLYTEQPAPAVPGLDGWLASSGTFRGDSAVCCPAVSRYFLSHFILRLIFLKWSLLTLLSLSPYSLYRLLSLK